MEIGDLLDGSLRKSLLTWQRGRQCFELSFEAVSRRFRNNEVRLQLHALAYNLANFMRTLALPRAMAHWSLTTLREKLVKIGARMVRHGRYVTFQLAEVAVSGRMFGQILARIARLRAPPPAPA